MYNQSIIEVHWFSQEREQAEKREEILPVHFDVCVIFIKRPYNMYIGSKNQRGRQKCNLNF